MALKDDVIRRLMQNREETLSGQQLADEFGVSRAAVWKAVNALKAEGHQIEAESNRGYRLAQDSDILTEAGLSLYLQDFPAADRLIVYPVCASTNTLAKELAVGGAADGTCVVTNEQTQGRGRRGHTFFSPKGGIYLSMVLRPQLTAQQCTFLTLAAAVAVCRSVEAVCGLQPRIKWVNDVFLNGKKICGILTEASADLEGGSLEYAVVGIGLNVWMRESDLPEDIREIAGGIYTEPPTGNLRTRLTAELIRTLYSLVQNPEKTLEEYRTLSFLPGREITVLTGRKTGNAKALSITEEGHLLVEFPDGETLTLTAGEVSVRGKES